MRAPPGFLSVTLCGTGATSRVFRAEEARSGRVVALKRLHRQLLRSTDGLARLKREFDALSRLRHPSLAAVRDVIRWEGDPTVVMDFIEGRDLDRRIADDGPLDGDTATGVARALFEVLAAAHGAGIVHRDVKPQNVRIADDGRVYLLDFGSARFDAASQLTANGTSVGTPDYMAPELFAGAVYDPRVDVYGVGATLFKALTGHPPQVADSLTELAFKRTREAVPPIRTLRPDVPEALAQVIDRCLERVPDDRFASCALALWALDHPQAELSFQRRRKSHPPCLHCSTPIAPESTVCPRCGSDHPFVYGAGSHHVVVHNVRSPEAFVQALLTRFPERAGRGHLRHLAERISALDRDSQRLISFTDETQAHRLADELEAAGAQCEVVEDQGTSGWRLYGWSLALFITAFMAFGHWVLGADIGWSHALLLVLPTVGALALERGLAVAKGEQSILSSGRYPAPVIPNLRSGLVLTSGGLAASSVLAPVAASALGAAGAAGVGAIVASLAGPLFAGSVLAAGTAAVAWWASFTPPPAVPEGSPEPGLGSKLRSALSAPRSLTGRRLRAETAVLVAAAVLSLVPAEFAALDAVRRSVPTFAQLMAPSNPILTAPVAPAPSPWLGGGMTPVPTDGLPAVSAGPALPVDPAPTLAAPGAATSGWAATLLGGFALSALALVLHIFRRRRRVVQAARSLERDLWSRALGDGRRPPRRRRTEGRLAADRLALVPSPDAFLLAARTRAADLAHCLGSDGVDRLRVALEGLEGQPAAADAAVRSVLARSIVDSDPEQRLRFDLLALEGELEAVAAGAWWARVREDED